MVVFINIFVLLKVDDVSLHGKDNQQAVEILKQTGPVVRLKVARHVSQRLHRTQSPSSLSAQSSGEVAETSLAMGETESEAQEPKHGKLNVEPLSAYSDQDLISLCVSMIDQTFK